MQHSHDSSFQVKLTVKVPRSNAWMGHIHGSHFFYRANFISKGANSFKDTTVISLLQDNRV